MKKLTLSKILMYCGVSLFSIMCLIPMILMLMVSITDESAIIRNGYSFIPQQFSLYAYKLIFQGGSSVVRGYVISIFITVVGTAAAVCITGMAAYTLSNKNVRYRNTLALYFFVTMIFTSGVVPWYMICRAVGTKDNIFALLIPNLLFNPFNLFLTRNFMNGLPDSLRESATIDGANDAYIAFKIYFPLSIPALATVGLFYGLAYWNDWWNAIILVDNDKLYPIQYLLLQLRSQVQMLRDLQYLSGTGSVTPPAESIKMATAIITIGPIVVLYPYLQKYFVKGLIIGSVKG
jgi:putative aldouronate transport system permease protein